MTEELDWMTRANLKAKGKRPDFLGDPEEEKMLSMLMAVIGEVSVLRERLDTVERLLDAKGTISRADIERYQPDRAAGQERGEMIREYIARVMRGPHQAVQALEEFEPPVQDVVDELREG
ncbi:MAG: hypothetical protein ACTS1X_01165 [Parasphingopyxis sp.]|uniref:hypothetical protein n=1 Tax=Parasphingopyxis sp. TaxID=1920299 RepID=UPI003FA05D74